MGKRRITKKDFLRMYPIYRVGSYDMYTIGSYLKKNHLVGYNSGKFGWNYDAYLFGDCYLVFGDRPIGEKNKAVSEIIANCAKQVKTVYENCGCSAMDIAYMVNHYLSKSLKREIINNQDKAKEAANSSINSL